MPIQAQSMPNQTQNRPNQAQNMPNQAQNTIRDGPVRLLVVNKETGRDKILSLNKSCSDGGRTSALADYQNRCRDKEKSYDP